MKRLTELKCFAWPKPLSSGVAAAMEQQLESAVLVLGGRVQRVSLCEELCFQNIPELSVTREFEYLGFVNSGGGGGVFLRTADLRVSHVLDLCWVPRCEALARGLHVSSLLPQRGGKNLRSTRLF